MTLLVEPFAFFGVGVPVGGGGVVEGGEVGTLVFFGVAAVEDLETSFVSSSTSNGSGGGSSACHSSSGPGKAATTLLTPGSVFIENLAIVVGETVGVDETIVVIPLPSPRDSSYRSSMSNRNAVPTFRRRRRRLHERRVGGRRVSMAVHIRS